MSELWTGFVDSAEAWSVIVALIALVVSLYALRRSGPRVRVSMESTLIVSPTNPAWSGKSALVISVTNDGAQAARIQSVDLVSEAGVARAESAPGTSLPFDLDAHGGSERWLVDRNTLRRIARRDGGEQPVAFRAVAQSGRRLYRSSSVETVHPLEPNAVALKKVTLRGRLQRAWAEWFSPRLQHDGLVDVASIDLESGTLRMRVRNVGGGVARGATLELMEDVGAEQRRVREAIPVPPVWRHRSVALEVPIVDRDDLTWWLRVGGRARVGTGAVTFEAAKQYIADHQRWVAAKERDQGSPGVGSSGQPREP